MIACPKCGFDNELGRIFCHQCGTKLDLNAVKPPGQGGPKIRRRGRRWTPGRIARRALELVVIALVVWAVYLMCQVPAVHPIKPTNADLLAADNKRLKLDDMVLRQRSASLEITESELNTFIGSLSFKKPKNTGVEVVPITIQAKLDDGVVRLICLRELRIGTAFSKKFYIEYAGVPVVEDNFFELQPVAAYIGQFPIQPKLLQITSFIQNSFTRLLIGFSHERDLLDKLSSISVAQGKAVLNYKPPEQPAASSGRAAAH
jgi:hypothetical protein